MVLFLIVVLLFVARLRVFDVCRTFARTLLHYRINSPQTKKQAGDLHAFYIFLPQSGLLLGHRLLLGYKLLHPFRCYRLRTFQREAQRPVPAQAGQYTQRTRYAKQYCVEFFFYQSIVFQQCTRVRIHIRPWVFDLACSFQYRWCHLIYIPYSLYSRVVRAVAFCKFHLRCEAWNSLCAR